MNKPAALIQKYIIDAIIFVKNAVNS